MNLTIAYRGGFRFDVSGRDHTIVTDQPTEDGGNDAGMTPVELFVASLGTCVGYFVARYCARHQISSEGLSIELDWDYAEQPHRVGEIRLRLMFPADIPVAQQQALLMVAQGCTVHRSLTMPPKIEIELVQQSAMAEGA